MPNRKENKPPDQPTAEVVPLFGPVKRKQAKNEPPPTSEELAAFRRMRPLLEQMLVEWGEMTARTGCPVAHQIIHGRK